MVIQIILMPCKLQIKLLVTILFNDDLKILNRVNLRLFMTHTSQFYLFKAHVKNTLFNHNDSFIFAQTHFDHFYR
jgi:hypothetical protein